jgi:predicted Rossmann fold flavoprotein
VIVGAGAAGLATAIFARRANPDRRVVLLEGARAPGAKILVSGGSRCNVTNTVVTEADFNGGRPAIVRRVLRAFPVPATVAFFREIGIPLHEEPNGKLFPDSNRSRDVVDALLREAAQAGVELRAGTRVVDVSRDGPIFRVETSRGPLTADALVLATGGLSLPKTGSDGWGYGIARRFGHTIVPTTPALAPMVIDRDRPDAVHISLSGVSQPVQIDLRLDGRVATRIDGALLWTHFGVSGPAALDVSRHWLRARLDGHDAAVTANLLPGRTFESLEDEWIALIRTKPKRTPASVLAESIPASVASALLDRLQVPPDRVLADLPRDERRRLLQHALAWPLPFTDSRGYSYAEVTAGGVALTEIDPATMASRVCPGLYLVGEILDVDGRLGGFNFQWAWSSARVAGRALAQVPGFGFGRRRT